MPLQTSGQISLNDIQNEFGGTNPTSITEYYRGGSFVPDTTTNSSIPTSGQISFDDFYGGSVLVAFIISTVTDSRSVCGTRVGPTAYFDDGLNVGSNGYSDSAGTTPLDDGFYNTTTQFAIRIINGAISALIDCG